LPRKAEALATELLTSNSTIGSSIFKKWLFMGLAWQAYGSHLAKSIHGYSFIEAGGHALTQILVE
jgi:hypothetical protein